jgi:hypothetical protein
MPHSKQKTIGKVLLSSPEEPLIPIPWSKLPSESRYVQMCVIRPHMLQASIHGTWDSRP